ncbi:hypothetical protein NC652_029007 [Populus alba x Populus x berolinensis]|nr:hypothetical protein NC652_029007 [Populus alba x Populus x berolinensis]
MNAGFSLEYLGPYCGELSWCDEPTKETQRSPKAKITQWGYLNLGCPPVDMALERLYFISLFSSPCKFIKQGEDMAVLPSLYK